MIILKKIIMIKSKLKEIIYRIIFELGFLVFKITGRTPERSYQALVRLYCFSGGSFNSKLHEKIKISKQKQHEKLNGELGEYNAQDFEELSDELNENGYVEFKQKVSSEKLRNINKFAMETPTIVKSQKTPLLFDPNNLISEIYRFTIQDLINNKDIQDLIMDPVLINVAREYLDCEPIFDFPAMWWSTDFSKKASSDAAQLYHFDMDRVKWLKVFIYINDVNYENGPHCYIQKTHKDGSKPKDILSRGYVRVLDKELKEIYQESQFKVLPGEAGSVFAGDTKCWHKGMPLTKGNRLLLEFEYSSNSFGVNIPEMRITNSNTKFIDFCKENPVFSSRIKY